MEKRVKNGKRTVPGKDAKTVGKAALQTPEGKASGKKVLLPKPGNMLYPVPAVMVSLSDGHGKNNIITVAWTGTVCSDPAMVYISVRPSRYSYELLKKTGEFVINLPSRELVRAMDFCGVRSGAEVDKYAECRLHAGSDGVVGAPTIEEAPVSIGCRIKQVLPLGSHELFLAEVVSVSVKEELMDEKGVLHLEKAGLIAYEHGSYRALGKSLGSFGYSVKKKGASGRGGRGKKGSSTSGGSKADSGK